MMLNVGCQLRRLGRSAAIAAMAAAGMLMPATAAVSLARAAQASAATTDAAPTAKGIFAPPQSRSHARSYHAPSAGAETTQSASAAIGFWMLGGLVLMLLAASLAPRRKGCPRGRC